MIAIYMVSVMVDKTNFFHLDVITDGLSVYHKFLCKMKNCDLGD